VEARNADEDENACEYPRRPTDKMATGVNFIVSQLILFMQLI